MHVTKKLIHFKEESDDDLMSVSSYIAFKDLVYDCLTKIFITILLSAHSTLYSEKRQRTFHNVPQISASFLLFFLFSFFHRFYIILLTVT